MAKIWRNLKKNKNDLNAAAKSGAFIVFDTETTGLKNDDQIVEFAGCKCAFKSGKFCVYDILHIFIKPDKPIPDKASEVNGITNEFLADKMDERAAYPIIKRFMGDSPVVGAYNSGFDVRMLNFMYERNNDSFIPGLEIDLLKIAKDIFCEQKMKDHKLITIANTYGVDEGIQFHSALDDVKVLIRVINAMIEDISKNGVEERREPVRVYRLNYYEGFRGNSRLYVVSSKGMLYYELKNDKWKANDESIDIQALDMEDVERQVFQLAGCSDYKELAKKCRAGDFTRKKKEEEEPVAL